VIRGEGNDSIIICGTNTWSQDVDDVAGHRIDNASDKNIMYTLHFYAGTHKADLRNKAKKAINAGLALFVTEWGTTDASGNGNVDTASSDEWLTFLEENGISWCNWSLCNKNESSAALKSSATANGSFSDSVLSTSGAYVKKAMLKYSGADTTSGKTKVTPTPKVTAARTSDIKDDNSAGGIELYQFNQDKNDETSTLSPMFKVVNNSGKSVKLSNIEIYYYFNPDGNVDTVYEVDYADINGSNPFGKLGHVYPEQ
jgi:endoglucanase